MISKSQIKLVKQLEQKKHRQREGLFVAEGPKVVGDLLAAGFLPVQIFATAAWESPSGGSPVLQVITDDELRKLSFLQHPQQVLAVFPLPQHSVSSSENTENTEKFPFPSVSSVSSVDDIHHFILALDGVQDPGNLGTIIRIADWFGISRIVCSTDTADAWNPKVVQATMGSIARVSIVYTDLKEYLNDTNLPVYGTLLDGENIYKKELPREAIIVMGNEGNGISPEVRRLVTDKLLIPRFREGAESLNVAIATAITCSEFCRRSI